MLLGIHVELIEGYYQHGRRNGPAALLRCAVSGAVIGESLNWVQVDFQKASVAWDSFQQFCQHCSVKEAK